MAGRAPNAGGRFNLRPRDSVKRVPVSGCLLWCTTSLYTQPPVPRDTSEVIAVSAVPPQSTHLEVTH
jgi:hypothetical protein